MNEIGTKTYKAKYTPIDIKNYNSIENVDIQVDVSEKTTSLTPIKIPAVKTDLVYNGSEQIGVNTGEGYSLIEYKKTNAGNYKAIATLEKGYKWDDNSTDKKEILWSIKKAKPNGNPKYTPITRPYQILLDANLTTLDSDFNIPGTVKWINNDGSDLSEMTIVDYKTYYKWKFIPFDTNNYEIITGIIMPYYYDEDDYNNYDYDYYYDYDYFISKSKANTEKNDNKDKSKPTNNNSFNTIILNVASKEIMLFGKKYTIDVAPKITNGRTMIPARFIAESLGAKVTWNGQKRLVTIIGKNKENKKITILITIGSKYAIVNNKKIELESPAFIENDRTFTPIRFISENLGATVYWDENNKKITIVK